MWLKQAQVPCFASVKPGVQTPIPPKKKKEKESLFNKGYWYNGQYRQNSFFVCLFCFVLVGKWRQEVLKFKASPGKVAQDTV
jgi:hypothetical protein